MHILSIQNVKPKIIFLADLKTAAFIKYSINTFLASKVIFFNELHSIYEKINTSDSWESVINIISRDKRIGDSHMNVPGHDGRKGFGGACFPKDSLALAKFADSKDIDRNSKNCNKTNNKIRSKYKDLDSREFDQNVTYKDKI